MTSQAALSSAPELPFERLPTLQRFARGLRALKQLREDPNDTQLALRAALLLNIGVFPRALAAFQSCEEGRDVLRARPALDDSTDLDALLALPADTLGHAYASFLKQRGLTPEPFLPPREIHDPDMRYISQRLRQTHDLWHVVTGYDTDVAGEIELQAFTYGQLRTPFAFFVALGGLARARRANPRLGARVWRAFKRARRSQPLCFRSWERRFATPLTDVRRELGLS